MADPTAYSGVVLGAAGALIAGLTAWNNRKAARDTRVLGDAKIRLEERQTEDDEIKSLWTEVRSLRADLKAAEAKARQVERDLRAEQAWSMFLEDFLREHDMPIPQRPLVTDA